ncbi:MAG: phosphatase PAP2 family protein, partial [Ferruginibacter sp.]
AGLFIYGKSNQDYRAISTASQLAETFILMGVGTQLLKRISGRQSPSESTVSGGKWKIFPSFKHFQQNTPNYDAFPSGHLATLISTVTVLAENYPEKKWIVPVGYTITGLVGCAMINNKVHWASDYPLALALGYLCARQVVKNNRRIISSGAKNKYKPKLSYTVGYLANKIAGKLIYDF